MLDAGSIACRKLRFLRLDVLENVQHDMISPVSDRVYVLIMDVSPGMVCPFLCVPLANRAARPG